MVRGAVGFIVARFVDKVDPEGKEELLKRDRCVESMLFTFDHARACNHSQWLPAADIKFFYFNIFHGLIIAAQELLFNEKREFIMSFPLVYSCAKYLGVNKYRVNQSLKAAGAGSLWNNGRPNKSIVFNNQVYYVVSSVNQII